MAAEMAVAAMAVLGAFSLVGALSSLCSWLWRHFLRPAKDLTRYGSWALVTGCTDGIGKAFCFELAGRRLNLVLVGRSQPKLDSLAADLTARHRLLQVRTVLLDFCGPDASSGFARIEKLLSELDVGVLVNNAGLSYPYARFFHEVDTGLATDLIRLNVEAIARMVQAVLPHMLERRRGAIVNMGSGSASVLPSDPLYALYTGTKGFIEKFSRSLYVEYKSHGIDVQCQAPMHVATKLASIKKSSFFCPSPDAYARSGVRWIGYEPVCSPYWTHSLIWEGVNLLPQSLFSMIRFQISMNVRKRGRFKDAQKKQQL